jgi:hypothetical protein
MASQVIVSSIGCTTATGAGARPAHAAVSIKAERATIEKDFDFIFPPLSD